MTPALLATAFATLALALAASSAACMVLWRRNADLRKALRASAPGPMATAVPDRPIESRRPGEPRRDRGEGSRPGPIAPPSGGPKAGRTAARSAPPAGGPTLISVPSLASPAASSSPSEAAAELDRRFGGVWALADSGAPAEAVARRTGYPVGQVELILGLRRQLLAAEGGPDA